MSLHRCWTTSNPSLPKIASMRTLFLVPTQFELDCLSSSFCEGIQHAGSCIALCGFGVVVSAIRTTQLIARHSPRQVLLLGIAGALAPGVSVGEAVEFDETVCYGIGAGFGDGFVSPQEMGWSQWPEPPQISDSIRLGKDDRKGSFTLLTCCAASASEHDVRLKLKKHPSAVAEDMEGFSVAAACRFAGTPIRIVRGISNRAGDRSKENWRVRDAMASVEKSIGGSLDL